VPPHAFPAVDGSQPGRTASPRPSVGGVSEAGFDASSDWGGASEMGSTRNASVSAPPPIDRSALPKPPELIKAEMGVVLGKTLGRQVISVSLADDLPTAVAEWCAARNLAAGAQSKIFKELTSRLDAALAQAYQDAEQEPAPVLKGVDIC